MSSVFYLKPSVVHLLLSFMESLYQRGMQKKVTHNYVFRILMILEHCISMSHTFILYNVLHSDVIIQKAMFGFINRITESDNVFIYSLVNSSHYFDSSHFKYWSDNLFVINM